jgi:hypothetical protein
MRDRLIRCEWGCADEMKGGNQIAQREVRSDQQRKPSKPAGLLEFKTGGNGGHPGVYEDFSLRFSMSRSPGRCYQTHQKARGIGNTII